MKEELTTLLEKYYRGETTSGEEEYLKQELMVSGEHIPERDLFAFYASSGNIPEGTEEILFSGIDEKPRKRARKATFYLLSAAAVFIFMVMLYSGYREEQQNKKDFMVMEQALTAVSQSLQPETPEPDMLVLWLDNNVEVIIN